MSSLLLSLSSRPSLRKLALRCHTLRMFSSSSSTTTNPYLMYCVTYFGEDPEAGAMTKLRMFDLAKEELLNSCYRTQQLVESPSGQRFLVKWYVKSVVHRTVQFNFGGTKRFMVFREEEDMNMCYTEDIGDLCMFLDNNDPFCVKASSFPALNPNSIYFLGEGYGEGYGVYDIATRTTHSFNPKSINSGFCDIADSPNGEVYVVPDWVPHWIPPFPL